MNMEQWWNYTDRVIQRTRRKTCPSATLFTANLTWTDPGANPVLRGERPVTNGLSHDTASGLPYLVVKRPGMQLSSCIHPVPRSTMRGHIPSFPHTSA